MEAYKDLIKSINNYIETLESILENKQYICLDWSREAVEEELVELKQLVSSIN